MLIRGRRIVIVEDDDSDLFVISRSARRISGQEPEVYRDGPEAIHGLTKTAHSEPPALIFLDQRLPKVHGFDVLSAVRAQDATRYVPVVMFTSGMDPSLVAEGYRMGASAILSKGVDYKEFVAMIDAACRFWIFVAARPGHLAETPLGSPLTGTDDESPLPSE